jgi:hypothetical protein
VSHASTPLQNAVFELQAEVVGTIMRKTERALTDHNIQLLAKIMSIMMNRLAVHEDALSSLPWAKHLEMKRFETPSTYIYLKRLTSESRGSAH